MKKFVAKKRGMYVNYISLFSKHPLRLRNTATIFTSGNKKAKLQSHIIYSEKETKVLLELVNGIDIIEI